ncbi:MAG: hypothetical protein KDB14_06390 [Planctomycetales bacterium]|nr:hypothetical protein [Planctomycetales bacterium]
MTAAPSTSRTGAPAWPWLFSPAIDLIAFLGSCAISLLVLAWGARHGLLEQSEPPEWTWVAMILLVDVAHVYATGFRVYFDRQELSRRPLLYAGVPVACFVLSMAVYSESELQFWRLMAYLAVFHFVRQQYGWVVLYRARANETSAWGKRIDAAAIYLATIYPLVHWHASLPRRFSWFVPNDFYALPPWTARVALTLYVVALTAYAVKSARAWAVGRPNPGKDVVLITTAVCWYVGIVACNSDFAFTVTNVVIHGVPYMVLVWWYMLRRGAQREGEATPAPATTGGRWKAAVLLISTVWLLAYCEELVWNRAIWHEHRWLFGSDVDAEGWQLALVPLLAVPQLTHYVLDGFIWKRSSNPDVREIVER